MTGELPTNRPIVLVPIPSRKGYATTTLLLAEELQRQSKRSDIKVIDALCGNNRPSLFEVKKHGTTVPDSTWFGFRQIKDIPLTSDVFLVDNVESTGATMKAAIATLVDCKA